MMSSLKAWACGIEPTFVQLLVVVTATSLLVMSLRGPMRRWFGAERAAQLWWLPLLTMMACQLPHPSGLTTGAGNLPSMVAMIRTIADGWSNAADGAPDISWPVVALLLWLAGVASLTVYGALAQWRYHRRLRSAEALPGRQSHWPIRIAAHVDIGPALVGAWRVCIVLPVDFAQRYDQDEQALVIAHESMHAQRRDGCWCLLAGIVLALCWFSPLAWWCWRSFRQDLELACDAAVLRQSGASRRRYAEALLKTQPAAWALPVGCSWSSRHPLMERIAMLKQPMPGRRQQILGAAMGALCLALTAGGVYATSAPGAGASPASSGQHEYQLDLKLQFGSDDGQHRHDERSTLAVCMADGQSAQVRVSDWSITATTKSLRTTDKVAIDLVVSRAEKQLARQQLEGAVDQPLHAVHEGQAGDSYVFDVTPRKGCPARATADTEPMINEHVERGQVLDVAQSVASKAGWTLSNPDTLGNGVISLNFEAVPAREAMRLVAATVNMQPVFEGKQVRFEAK